MEVDGKTSPPSSPSGMSSPSSLSSVQYGGGNSALPNADTSFVMEDVRTHVGGLGSQTWCFPGSFFASPLPLSLPYCVHFPGRLSLPWLISTTHTVNFETEPLSLHAAVVNSLKCSGVCLAPFHDRFPTCSCCCCCCCCSMGCGE